MTDPVAAKSGFLSMYMSNHPDTLVAYVSHYTKNTAIASATMKAIDSKAGFKPVKPQVYMLSRICLYDIGHGHDLYVERANCTVIHPNSV